MPFRTSPNLGPQIDDVFVGLPYWDLGARVTEPSYQLGNPEFGSDGHVYIWVRASAAISATATTGTQVTVTEPAFTVATGAGGYWTPPGVAIANGTYFHVRKGAVGAP